MLECSLLVQDEERLKKAVNQVPTNEELNAMIARSEAELQLFHRLDAELAWPDQEGKPPPECFIRLHSSLNKSVHKSCGMHIGLGCSADTISAWMNIRDSALI